MTIKINLGCGNDIKSKAESWINVDKYRMRGVDVECDIEEGLPFTDDFADFVLMSHVLEHTFNPMKVLQDVHRMLKPGGTLKIVVPHMDAPPTWHLNHHHFFNEYTLNGLFKPARRTGRGVLFKLMDLKIKKSIFIPFPRCKLVPSGLVMVNDSLRKWFGFSLNIGTKQEITWVLKKVQGTGERKI